MCGRISNGRRMTKTTTPKRAPKVAISGWLILDKPLGITSAQAVGRVKRLLNPMKIGHGGTLDPLASGILPLALGEATKAFQFVASNIKTYRFTVQWGAERTTDDLEGEITQTSDKRPSQAEIEAALPKFRGEIMQAPPAFSAIKVDGARAYALARAGEEVLLPPRPVQVESLELLSADAASATFEMTCGKGTYVRSIARDLGREIGCFGHVTMLRRVRVGNFHENRSISLEKLEELVHSAAQEEWLLPIASVLADIPAVELDPTSAHRLTQGQTVSIPSTSALSAITEDTVTVQAVCENRLVAIATAQGGKLKTVRVFHA